MLLVIHDTIEPLVTSQHILFLLPKRAKTLPSSRGFWFIWYIVGMATKKKPEEKKLTAKQNAFLLFYIELGNATEAAAQAGYSGNRRTLAAIGSDNLTKPNIIAKMDEYYTRYGMGAAEIIARLAKIARSFDPTDYIVEKEIYEIGDDDMKYPLDVVQTVDLEALRKDGYSVLIKKIKQNTKGGMEIEYHDQVRALELLGKHHILFVERKEITGEGGGPITHDDITNLTAEQRANRIAELLDEARKRRDR